MKKNKTERPYAEVGITINRVWNNLPEEGRRYAHNLWSLFLIKDDSGCQCTSCKVRRSIHVRNLFGILWKLKIRVESEESQHGSC